MLRRFEPTPNAPGSAFLKLVDGTGPPYSNHCYCIDSTQFNSIQQEQH
jgi:hypothetical protein